MFSRVKNCMSVRGVKKLKTRCWNLVQQGFLCAKPVLIATTRSIAKNITDTLQVAKDGKIQWALGVTECLGRKQYERVFMYLRQL